MALKCNAVAHVMLLTSAASTRHVSASVVCVCQSLRGAPNSTRVTFHFLNKNTSARKGTPKKIALQFRQGKPVEFIRICKCRRQKCGIIVGKVLKMSHFNEKSLSTKSK